MSNLASDTLTSDFGSFVEVRQTSLRERLGALGFTNYPDNLRSEVVTAVNEMLTGFVPSRDRSTIIQLLEYGATPGLAERDKDVVVRDVRAIIMGVLPKN